MPRVSPSNQLVVVLALLAVGAGFFVPGINWGLPSRRVDSFLFGQHSVWSGREILQLAGPDDPSPGRAADISARPIERRDQPVVLNATDQDRARIVRRYRLMSYQPDEFETFKSLAEMKPSRGGLDPRMYKYGGLWMYPVGAMLKLAGAAGLVRLDPDQAYYLDHPEAFGRFYVVARLYSVLWGLIGIVAVFVVVRRITGEVTAGAAGALCFMMMPVVVNAAHEAKPHLAGAVLMLLAVIAASRFLEGGRRGEGILAAALCGAGVGMVPSVLPVVLVLPPMVIFSVAQPRAAVPQSTQPRGEVPHIVLGMGGALLVATLVYCITNPYVPINLFRNPAVLRSNFANSAAFYRAEWTGAGVPHALLLVGEGASFVLATAGLGAMLALAARAVRRRHATPEQEKRRRATGLLLAVPSLAVAGQFILFAAGQPADYARFALPFDIFLAVEAVVATATFVRPRAGRAACYAVLVLTTAYMGSLYTRAFLRDASRRTTRIAAADRIQNLLDAGNRVLATRQEPAPWSLPPANLFRWRMILPPRTAGGGAISGADVTVGPAELPPGPQPVGVKLLTSTPVSWASKRFQIEAGHRPGSAGLRSRR